MHDVDRYRGSCLIVSKPRGRGQAHLRTRGPNQEKQQHPQQQQQQQQQSGGGGGSHSSSHGGHHPPHMDSSYMMEGGSALAGMPLFSFLPQRRGSLRNPGRVQHHGRPQRSPSHHQASHQQHHHLHHYLGPQESSGEVTPGIACSPPKTATRLKGYPWPAWPCIPRARPSSCPPGTPRSSPPCSGLGARPARELAHGDASPPAGSDAVSVTSDEGSTGHVDTSLPRIIKPRKRRKKDRKPAPGSPPPGTPGEGERGGDPDGAADASGSIVTLKPYMPMCYNYDAAGDDQGPRGCESSRACGCGHCIAGHVFPTPPPSPASSSAMSSVISSSSSSCSSSSEDEPGCGGLGGQGGDGRSQLVRSLSEPQSSHPTIHISSTVTHSFAGHRDLDIRILRSVPRDVPTRTRHWSVPAAARSHPHPAHTPQSRGSSSYPSSASSAVSLLDGGSSQLSYHAVTTPQPPQRPWIPLAEPDRTKPSCIFTVMCYNVLCDKYATRQMYGYCPSWALEWEYRKKGIMDEIKHYLADIITLQEVETDQFYNFFLPELKSEGYDGIFSPKSRAKHMPESERKYVDGCAIFWRTSKFKLVKEHLIEFNQLAMANHDGSEDMLNRVMTKDNIGLAALLETKEAAWENSQLLPDKSQINQPVLVCTAHIHWDPEFCDVKLIQTIMLMSEVRQIISQIVEDSQHRSRSGHKMDPNSIQLLLCGDLNSLPDSGVVEFLTKGNVSMDHEDFKGFGYKTCLQKIAMAKTNNSLVNSNSNIYTHSFKLSAAYDFAIMAYTNYTYDFKGIIDYIFHSSETMSALGVLGPIDTDWFKDNKVLGCPHPHIPSDHFPLLVQLEMRPASASISQPNGLLHR